MSKMSKAFDAKVARDLEDVWNSHDPEDLNDDSSSCSSGDVVIKEASGNNSDIEVREARRLTEGDDNSIQIWRNVILFMLQVMATFVTVLTYIYLDHADIDNFNRAYVQVGETIKGSLHSNLQGFTEGAEGVATTVSAHALSTSDTWPNVTLPTFEVQVDRARKHSKVDAIIFAPIVDEANLAGWNEYSYFNQGWIDESFAARGEVRFDRSPISPMVYNLGDKPITEFPLAPYWQLSPPPSDPKIVNLNAFSSAEDKLIFDAVVSSGSFVIGNITDTSVLQYATQDKTTSFQDDSAALVEHHSTMMHPVFANSLNGVSRIVGIIFSYLHWESYLQGLLPSTGLNGIFLVLRNSCGQSFTYLIEGGETSFVGKGDLHEVGDLNDRDIDDYETVIDLSSFLDGKTESHGVNDCLYSVSVFPSTAFWNSYDSSIPYAFAIVVGFTSLLMATFFFTYDSFVETRTRKIVTEAAQSNAIVSSLFPNELRDRLFEEDDCSHATATSTFKKSRSGKHGLKNFLLGSNTMDGESQDQTTQKPIADLFPDTTIMFADLVGFTAWSSEREPSQVFMLLETLYQAFDEIVKSRRAFKVETVGDCYVAVCGLPEKRSDHALTMARVARDCVLRTHELTRQLEVKLGPDTSDLSIRVGLHSGSVTAGVLRGERARFQLFGDTMNVGARMEQTSQKGRIQISQVTADLLSESGKRRWVRPRDGMVHVKGKGQMQTHWLEIKTGRHSVQGSSHEESSTSQMVREDELLDIGRDKKQYETKTSRLINWNVEILSNLIKQIVARRRDKGLPDSGENFDAKLALTKGGTVLDEVKEIIELPDFDKNAAHGHTDPDSIELSDNVKEQLQEYVQCIAMLYRDNPFHNFEHASHVAMSSIKLLGRIVAPSDIEYDEYDTDGGHRLASTLHNHTYGITSDPLTQFSCCFCALVHDADHPGVPNTQMAKEHPRLDTLYKGKSLAEQNSIELAWTMFMDDRFHELRTTLCANPEELQRFRQLVVNSVMATDVMDKDLKVLRNARWDRAFAKDADNENDRDNVNRKATIVIEHLIQASDVAHTMQHWHVYRKWNAKLFTELTKAYREGRAEKDPATFWYEGEIGFLDFYIIPLAKKLKDCGVFGVSSDEYLDYAMQNRQEWAEKGREVVAELVESLRQEGPLKNGNKKLGIVKEHLRH